jgi:hypothetical protein
MQGQQYDSRKKRHSFVYKGQGGTYVPEHGRSNTSRHKGQANIPPESKKNVEYTYLGNRKLNTVPSIASESVK